MRSETLTAGVPSHPPSPHLSHSPSHHLSHSPSHPPTRGSARKTVLVRKLAVDGAVASASKRLAAVRPALRGVLPIVVLLIWQLTSSASSNAGFSLPSPMDVVRGFHELWLSHDIQTALVASLGRAALGFALGLAIGVTLGLANGLSQLSEELFDSTLQIVRVIPFIAVVPLFVVWFGIGETLKLVLISMACVFPAYINTYTAVRLVDRRLIEVGNTFGFSRVRIVLRIILPSALPTILVGVRYAMSTALLALIVAEQVNSNAGIGHLIYLASNALRIDLIVVGISIYAILGIVIDVGMRLIERRALPWLDRGAA